MNPSLSAFKALLFPTGHPETNWRILLSLMVLELMEMIPGRPGVSEVPAMSPVLFSHTQKRGFLEKMFHVPLTPLLGLSPQSQPSLPPLVVPILIQTPL